MQRTPQQADSRREKLPKPPKIRLANWAIMGLSGLVVAGFVIAGAQLVALTEHNAELAANYTPTEITITTSESTQRPAVTTDTPVSDAIDKLSDRDEPWTMTVLGDSTGNERTEWVELLVGRLTEATGRPAVIHTWDVDANEYGSTRNTPGTGEPIVVWNGSASGMRAAYSRQHIDVMAPEISDLVVINHGHNQHNSDQAVQEIESIVSWTKKAEDKQPAIAITLQNPSMAEKALRLTKIVDAIRAEWDGAANIVLIDVYTAFHDSGDAEGLLRNDELHPADAGSKLWADTAWKALDLGQFEG